LLKKINNNLKIFEGKYVPLNIKNFNRNKKFIIFSGLGNPEEYERTLKKYKFKIKEKFVFPDHHKFSNSEIKKIKKIAKNNKLEIITTEKDYFRLNNKNKKNIKFLKVNLQIKNIKKFSRFLEERL
jgi:tetraacyldisaccharide 4'-kinase